jgi:hypothetical protein
MVLLAFGLFKKFFRAESDPKMRFSIHSSQLEVLFRINADGSISRSAELILLTCHTAVTCEDLPREVKPPLFHIRSASRELTPAGLLY